MAAAPRTLKRRKSAGVDRLPGEPTASTRVAAMLRVDQAGEYGAARIYDGQLAVLADDACAPAIRKMRAQEAEHLAAFDRLVAERKVRPTLLSPLWHLAGFALGAGTALLGREAAMAATVAVEEVIDDHYARQVERLGDDEPELKKLLAEFRADEAAHRAEGLAQGAERAPGYSALTAAIRAGTRAAIWLSTRV
ncbi:MAG: demethoxyubiquinone hydroxylase family protein [Alphaproteobacteria bacterium]|nr:demethoxyubiquinone hydroxylase family protein [Alphaproteobacteria bacterium]